MKSLTAYFDGASKGNPGPAGIGGVILDGPVVLHELSRYIGKATNNQAEYTALLEVLRKAKEIGAEVISIFSDSELVVRQLNGEYRIKDAKLKVLYDEVNALRPVFQKVTFRHVPREQNKLADALANQAVSGAGEKAEKEWIELSLQSLNLNPLLHEISRKIEHDDALAHELKSLLSKIGAKSSATSSRLRIKRDGKAIEIEL